MAKTLNPKDFNKLYLNGEYIASHSTETYTLKNPKDNSVVISDVPVANAQDIDDAVAHAEAAFRGPWSKFTAIQRTECFLKLAELLADELSSILTLDSQTSGIPVSLAPVREFNYIKNCLIYYAGWTDKQRGDYFPADDGKAPLPHYRR